ncbi:MAG TPA: hypothetical protein PLO65_14740 [Caulobacter sp.]|nr:hypothetical protein [Caulobacter sp.]
MTDVTDRPHEDRVLPAVVYALYLLSLPSAWVAVLIGLVLAYANRDTAGPRMATHYQFLIQTFWKSIWWAVIGVVLVIVGGIFSVLLIGIPVLIAGGLILAGVHIWFYVRVAVGLIYLAQDQPYPRPDAWLF